MKKFIIFIFLLLFLGFYYYYREFSDYSVINACVEIVNYDETNNSKNDENCLQIHVNKRSEDSDCVIKEVNGVRYKVFFVRLEKKNDDHIEKTEEMVEEHNELHEKSFSQELEKDPTDIAIAVMDGKGTGVADNEFLDSLINFQARHPYINLIVTDGFDIPEDRIVIKSATAIDLNGVSSKTTVKYKIIVDNNRHPFYSIVNGVNRIYPDTGKMEKKQ